MEYTEIRAKLYDTGGFSYVSIWGGKSTNQFSSLHNGWYNVTLDIGFLSGLGEYTIHLKAIDKAGNELTYDVHGG